MSKDKRSFFEKLTGAYKEDDDEQNMELGSSPSINKNFMEEVGQENEEGQLTVDVYQTPTDIIVQAIVAGVKEEDLDVSITQDMVTLRGRREDGRRIERDNFFYQELYWGSFTRSILLPQEVDPDEAEATLKNGLLTVKLPKLDKERVQKVKIKKE